MFHVHNWKTVSAGQYIASSALYPDAERDTTLVLTKCSKCGAHKTVELRGHWTMKELE